MRTALISGGTGGLGIAVTQRFLGSGWRCVVPHNDPEGALRLTGRLGEAQALERLHLIEADLFDERAVGEVVRVAAQERAPLAALVNLVGGFDAPGPVQQTPIALFEKQLQVNLRATYLLCAASLGWMLERGDGAIVCVSSRAALRPFGGAAGYITAKAAVLAFVDALAAEHTAAGIRVNAIIPSVIDTPANRAAQPDADFSLWVSPEQIAQVIAFLCTEEAIAISGAHIPVYGRA